MALQILGEWVAGWGGLVILFGSERESVKISDYDC